MAYVINPWLYQFMRDHSTQINFAKAVELLRLVRKIAKNNQVMSNPNNKPLLVVITALSSFLSQQPLPWVGSIELRNVLDMHLNPIDAFYVDNAIRVLSYPLGIRPKEITDTYRDKHCLYQHDLWESMLDIIDDARRIIAFDIAYEIMHMQKSYATDDIIAKTVLHEISIFSSACKDLFHTKAGRMLALQQLESASATYDFYLKK
jgi:hypothetical protein